MRGVCLALAVGASIISSAATPVHALSIVRLTRLGDGDVRPGDTVRVQIGFDFSDTTVCSQAHLNRTARQLNQRPERRSPSVAQ